MAHKRMLFLLIFALFLISNAYAQPERWNEFVSKAIYVDCPCNGMACDFNIIDCKCNVAKDIRNNAIILLSQGLSVNDVFMKLGLPAPEVSNASADIGVASQIKPPSEGEKAIPKPGKNGFDYRWIFGIVGVFAVALIFYKRDLFSEYVQTRKEEEIEEGVKASEIEVIKESIDSLRKKYEEGEISESLYKELRSEYEKILEEPSRETVEVDAEREALQDMMDKLDQRYKRGEISKKTYKKLKRKLEKMQ